MATLDELKVIIGADVAQLEAGIARAEASLRDFGTTSDAAATRYTDAQGRIREANGRYVSSATLAAEAAGNVGGSLGRLSDTATRTAGTFNGSLVSSFAAFDRAVKPLNEGIGRLGQGAKDLGGSLTTYVTLPLGLAAVAAVAASAKMDTLARGLNAVAQQQLGDIGVTGLAATQVAATQTAARLKELQEIAKAPGIGFEEAVKGDIRLRAVGISAEQSAKVLREFANAIATTGGGAAELNSVTVQLGQLSAKGKVLAQDLRPIIEAAPAVATALKKLYGTVDSETISTSLAKQGKSSTEFVAILTDELAKLPRVTGGLANTFENIAQGVTQDAALFGSAIVSAFNIEGVADGAIATLDRITGAFTALDPATQRLILFGAAGVGALGPLIFVAGAVVAAIPPVIAGLEVLGVASLAALAPVAGVALAVGAAAALIVQHWDELKAYFSAGGEGGRVFGDLADSVVDAIATISAAFNSLNGGGSLAELISATGILKALFRDVAVGITSALNTVSGLVKIVAGLLSGDLSKAADGAKQAFFGLVDPIANVLGFTKALQPEVAALTTVLAAQTSGVLAARGEVGLYGDVLGLGVLKVRDYAAGILTSAEATALATKNAQAQVKVIGILADLEARLKAAKEQRTNDTTVADIEANNKLIASLQAQIDKLEGVNKAGKKMSDALEGVQRSLRTVNNESLALGNAYDFIKSKQQALEAGVKTLLAAGYSPFSATVRGLVAQLRELNDVLGDNATLATGVIDGLAALAPKGDRDNLGTLIKRNPLDQSQLPDTSLPKELPSPVLPDYNTIFKNAARDVVAGYSLFTQAQADFNTQSEALLDAFPAQAFAGIGQSIGDAFLSGGDVLESAGKALLRTIGSIATQYGQLMIALGVADIASGFFVAKGIGEIAAGTALIAAGTIVGGLGGLGSRGSTATAGGGSSLASAPRTNFTSVAAQQSPTQTLVTHVVQLTARGGDLVAALDITGNRNRRVV